MLNNLFRIINEGINRRTSPPQVKAFVETYGNIPIKQLIVCKTPIKDAFDAVINIVSLGQWNEAKSRLNYDKMYHLYMVAELMDGNMVIIEKNEVLNIGPYNPINYENDEPNFKIIPKSINRGKGLNIQVLLNNAVIEYGEDRIFTYSADLNNCQRFITDILTASKLINPSVQKYGDEYSGTISNDNRKEDNEIYEFINQDTFKLMTEIPTFTRDIINLTTGTATALNRLIYGGKKQTSNIQAVLFEVEHWDPKDCEEWLKHHEMEPSSENAFHKKPMHETAKFYRYRLMDPQQFKRFTVKPLKNNMQLIIGFY